METQTPLKEKPSAAPLMSSLDELNNFTGDPAQFLARLLEVKCRAARSSAAALLRRDSNGKVQVLAMAPAGKSESAVMPTWLAEALRFFPKEEVSSIQTQYIKNTMSQKNERQCVAFLPVTSKATGLGTEVHLFEESQFPYLSSLLDQLQLLMPYFDFYEGRLKLKDYQSRTERLHEACEVLIKLNQSRGFLEAAMHMCNEMAARFSCSRVGIGVLKGRYIRLTTLSNTEKFNGKMKILQDLEKTMEESLDQDLEVLFPQTGQADYVAREAASYSSEHGPLSILSMPLRRNGEVKAVITFERGPERPFSIEEVELFRLICDLFSARLLHMHDYERWFGARALSDLRRIFSFALGARHTWLKLALVSAIAGGIWLSQARGLYQVEASFTFSSKNQQLVVAPFDAEIDEVFVRNGDEVNSGDKLLVLDTTEQRLQLENLLANRHEALKRVSVAMNEAKTADAQIAQAEADQIASEIKLIRYNIGRAILTAPIDGSILTDDLHKRLYSVAQFGESLIEVVQLKDLEVILYVPEDQIADVKVGFRGELAAAAYPDKRMPFEISEIKKVAQVDGQQNVFQLKAKLSDQGENFLEWARPGMEGVARIDVEERLQAWIWTRKAINYLRMKFWF